VSWSSSTGCPKRDVSGHLKRKRCQRRSCMMRRLHCSELSWLGGHVARAMCKLRETWLCVGMKRTLSLASNLTCAFFRLLLRLPRTFPVPPRSLCADWFLTPLQWPEPGGGDPAPMFGHCEDRGHRGRANFGSSIRCFLAPRHMVVHTESKFGNAMPQAALFVPTQTTDRRVLRSSMRTLWWSMTAFRFGSQKMQRAPASG
jgi:hypothetical protein